jgi:hypothetical protein
MIGLKWTEADTEASCLRLEDSKEGESIRPIGLPVVEYLERRRTDDVGTHVFPGQGDDNAFGSFRTIGNISSGSRRIATRYDKLVANDLAFVQLASIRGGPIVSFRRKMR